MSKGDSRSGAVAVAVISAVAVVLAALIPVVGEYFKDRTTSDLTQPSGSSATPLPAETATVPNGKPGLDGKPGPDNTGVPASVTLKHHEGDLRVTKAGQVISGMDIHGFVTIEAPDVVIENSRIRGGKAPSAHRALVMVNSPNHSVIVRDSELAPDEAHWNVDGVRGMSITAERVNMHKVVDHFHIYGDRVTIRDSWLHDNADLSSDPNGSGEPTHDDNIQIQKGNNIRIEGNNISGSNNAAIMVTQDQAQVADLTIRGNFLDGGSCIVNFKDRPDRPAPSGVTIWDNTFGRSSKWPDCGIKNPDYSFKPYLKNNRFSDGKEVGITR